MTANQIIDFWFGENPEAIVMGRDQLWFGFDPVFDSEIKTLFGDTVIAASNGELDNWMDSAQSSLALIILLDQLTRNIHRGSGQAFANDALARSVCRQGLVQGFDMALTHSQRIFYYLPLEHSESIEDQQQSVSLFDRLTDDVVAQYGEQYRAMFDGTRRFAHDHYDIIKQFGRFPHRNLLLGRESTKAELDYLKSGGKTFGQSDQGL